MIIIEGFQLARSTLARQPLAELYSVSPAVQERLREIFGTEIDPESAVRRIISDVRQRRDAALVDYTFKIDGIHLAALEISRERISNAYQEVSQELVSALKLAAERIRYFHTEQKANMGNEFIKRGLGQLIRPLERVGVYVPGGRASYPSTVLMTAVPAKVAGVKAVVLVTPPAGGVVSPAILVAADIAGVDRVFGIGGAQAVAALAYGTESVPKVDKICGPGNIFVTLAKKLVYGVVAIDGLQGPSEVLIIADETANPKYCALEILAQAEHDPAAAAIMVTTSHHLADQVVKEVEQRLKTLERHAIILESLENRGLIAVVSNLDEAIALANLYAPEHLCLMIDGAEAYLDKVFNAGCVFVGQNSTVVLGDYVAGPSHALPTGGTARFSSPLNIADFIKFISVVNIDDASLAELGRVASVIARAEGFESHAQAAEERFKRS